MNRVYTKVIKITTECKTIEAGAFESTMDWRVMRATGNRDKRMKRKTAKLGEKAGNA